MTNPFSKLSQRSIRVIYTFLTLIVLCLCLLNLSVQIFERATGNDQCRWVDQDSSRLLIKDVVRGGVADQAGIKDGDILVKIDGRNFKTGTEAELMISKKAGSYVIYTIERGGVEFQTRVLILKLINLVFLSQFLFGLGFLFVGYVVVMVKPQGKIQRMFGRFSLFSMLFFGLSQMGLDTQTIPLWQVRLLSVGSIVASIFAPPLFIRFFLIFPIKRKGHSSKMLIVILFAVSILITTAIIYLARIGNQFLAVIFFFSRYGFFFTGFGIFIHSYFHYVPYERRAQLRPVLIGVAICLLIFAYAFAIQTIDPLAPFLNPPVIFPVMLLVPGTCFFWVCNFSVQVDGCRCCHSPQFDLRNCYRSTGGYISGFCLWNWLTCKLLFWRTG